MMMLGLRVSVSESGGVCERMEVPLLLIDAVIFGVEWNGPLLTEEREKEREG